MNKYKLLKGNEIFLDKNQLERYIEKLAKEQVIGKKADKETYPVSNLKKDFEYITKVYNLLNEHIKKDINIHPAGEWILDNYYIIEENVKAIQSELTVKAYKRLPSIATGTYKGFARIYVLASQIIKYTNNNINKETIEELLRIYENNKNLTMDEFWQVQNFLKMIIIQNIAEICEKIYSSQMQKNRAIEIIEKTIENKNVKVNTKYNISEQFEAKSPFIEFMAYRLKKYGKEGYPYLKVLEQQVLKKGTKLDNVIKKEHFSIAVAKVSVGNAINSIKTISRINFEEIFEKINGVEEILKQDPAGIYEEMTFETKIYYRNSIKKIAEKNNISEIYVINKALELAKKETNEEKKKHIGYYLISNGKQELLKTLGYTKKEKTNREKYILYIIFFFAITFITTFITGAVFANFTNVFIGVVIGILIYLPITEIYLQIINYIFIKLKKPLIIPKLNFNNGVTEENATFVVIPTIINSKEKAINLIKKLEVYYLANKSENIYFAILGDCTTRNEAKCKEDEQIIEAGKKAIEELNKKYKAELPKFHFLYRKRQWCATERSYLGWERKRGLLMQFNEFLLNAINNPDKKQENDFIFNSLENIEIPTIKYIITLDGDTNLTLNSGLELIGAMAHILNKPVIRNGIVVEGYGIIQPRIGLDLNTMKKSLFTEIFSEKAGIDLYSKAISDVYQDNFEEAVFTGKGIYDLEVFNEILSNSIPENKVLSHDLLEGNYLKCGLATDILLLDGYPSKYNSYMARNHRWIRGDWQIVNWLFSKIDNKNREKVNNPLNQLSKFKIFENLRRSLVPIMAIILLFINTKLTFILGIITVLMPTIIDLVNFIVFRKENNIKQVNFSQSITGIKQSLLKGIIDIVLIPDRAYVSANAIVKTLYRLKTKNNLLEWITAEESEKLQKTDLSAYYRAMYSSVLLGVLMIMYFGYINIALGLIWMFSPYIMWYISREKEAKAIEIDTEEKEYIIGIAKKTFSYFKEYINEQNNYLPPDNYQEDGKLAKRTSSTNIGLGLLTIVAGFDFKFINKEETLELLEKTLRTIEKLPKWNGHLYNWYNTEDLSLLMPRYISTVDSGNFIGYLYVLKQFLIEQNAKQELITLVQELIDSTDFSVLYNPEIKLFSIGFNIEENKLTDSYYDFLASEARQASLIAIAKKDVEAKHWNVLSRTLTILNGYKGLVSWSGTAFEYLMPNINIKKYEGSLLDESCKFLIMSSEEYAKKFDVPWGISESAFNLKDLDGNYQYKAFGIPWLGLKRGLADDLVIAPYASILAINEEPKKVIKNLKELDNLGMVGNYGFYEAIDYTPSRLNLNKKYAIVKNYMAHHQGLILLSIDNLINNNVIQKRFNKNPEIEAIDILLQEQMPQNVIITKEKKEKIEKLKYIDYEDYAIRCFNKVNYSFENTNLMSNGQYSVFATDNGEGYSKFGDIYINRYKKTREEVQGTRFYIKNIKSKEIWSSIINTNQEKLDICFTEAENTFKFVNGNIQTTFKTTISPEDNVEIRKIKLKNIGEMEETLEISSVLEPILSRINEDIAHPAFNSLFVGFERIDDNIIINRRKREQKQQDVFVGVNLFTDNETIGELELEIDKTRLFGRNNIKTPKLINESIPFSNKIGIVVEPILGLRKTLKIDKKEKVEISLIITVSNKKQDVLKLLEKYKNREKINRTFELAKARVEAENRYLGITNKDIENYQQMITYLIHENYTKQLYAKETTKNICKQSELWRYGISGDIPILLVIIKSANDMETLREILKAYEYFRYKKINLDLVIINEEENSYEQSLKAEIENSIQNSQISYLINHGIYILNNIENENRQILEFRANLTINAASGTLKTILKEKKEEFLDSIKRENNVKLASVSVLEEKIPNATLTDLKYYNEYGGFSNDGKEFLIRINKNNKLPTVWSHILANDKFGTLITETMGGYTWNGNSRLNRITAWNNSQTVDMPSEIIYLRDKENNNVWTMGYSVIPANIDYYITYGFGYAKYNQINEGISQQNEIFVPLNDALKVNKISLKNTQNTDRKLELTYYMKPVLGEDELSSKGYITTEYNENMNYIILKNLSNCEKNVYISSSEKILSYTASKKSFIGSGDITTPDGIKKETLDNKDGLFQECIVAIKLEINLSPYEEKEFSIILGEEETYENVLKTINRFNNMENINVEFEEVRKHWQSILNKIQVQTPLESINILLNGWIIYQTLVSRMLGRTGYYQSGGAFGFRDQLQDTLGLKYFNREMMRQQIIRASKHQFKEGDVEHWWHEDNNSGIRTRFSDDLLWLPYIVTEYVKFTGNYKLLEEEIPFLEGEILKENEDEKYDVHLASDKTGSILEHCIASIEKGINLGQNGLIKIGSGDWNDGFSTVGNKGIGESIWLSFFVYDVLERFIEMLETFANNYDSNNINIETGTNKNIIEKINEISGIEKEGIEKETERERGFESLIKKYREIQENLKKSLNQNGWDGRWFKRAYTDDGKVLGTIGNEECKIDSIAQSWSIISNAADNDKKYIAFESLEKYLVDKEHGIIKLLSPAFDKSDLEPGYIKAYPPGIRENGGQYTHGALWTVMAATMLGFGEKAVEYYKMLTPIEHSRTKEAVEKYKVEPYVIPADVYGVGEQIGRGGWTWYTGSSSWYYKIGLENILGFKIENGKLKINPSIPSEWKEYKIRYVYRNEKNEKIDNQNRATKNNENSQNNENDYIPREQTIYNITINNPNGKNTGVERILLNGMEIEEKSIHLIDDGKINYVEVYM